MSHLPLWPCGVVVDKQEKETKTQQGKKQQKNRKKGDPTEDELEAVELLQKPREYVVKFTFPQPPKLNPPILGLYCKYECLMWLYKHPLQIFCLFIG